MQLIKLLEMQDLKEEKGSAEASERGDGFSHFVTLLSQPFALDSCADSHLKPLALVTEMSRTFGDVTVMGRGVADRKVPLSGSACLLSVLP